MKNYLSFGGGVNSVAMMLMLLDQGVDFEAVFCHHGTDWPETYDYVAGFQWWLKDSGHKAITVIRPDVNTVEGRRFSVLYDYFYFKKIFPARMSRMCTDRFKQTPLKKYYKQNTPCFVNIGIDSGESHRAKIYHDKGIEYRYPLVENDIDRDGCKQIILDHGLMPPPKSGCYICPFQPPKEYKRLRMEHPDLFCAAETLENRYIKRRAKEGKEPIYILKDRPLKWVVDEYQSKLWEEDEYPPCSCHL